jgi:ribosomal protein S24E
MQIIQLTNTDLAFFKNNIDDFQKRNKQIYAPAERLNTLSTHARKFETTVTVKDNEIISKKTVREGILKSLMANKELSNVDIASIASQYGIYNNIIFTHNNIKYGENTNNEGVNSGYYKIENGNRVTITKEDYLTIKDDFLNTGKKV